LLRAIKDVAVLMAKIGLEIKLKTKQIKVFAHLVLKVE